MSEVVGTVGINLDPHDECTFNAAENLEGKRFYLVTINEKGEVALAKAGETAFVLINEPGKGESATIAVPLQVQAICAEAIKPGWKLKVNSEGKLVKGTAEDHIIGIALGETKASGGIVSICSTPYGTSGP